MEVLKLHARRHEGSNPTTDPCSRQLSNPRPPHTNHTKTQRAATVPPTSPPPPSKRRLFLSGTSSARCVAANCWCFVPLLCQPRQARCTKAQPRRIHHYSPLQMQTQPPKPTPEGRPRAAAPAHVSRSPPKPGYRSAPCGGPPARLPRAISQADPRSIGGRRGGSGGGRGGAAGGGGEGGDAGVGAGAAAGAEGGGAGG